MTGADIHRAFLRRLLDLRAGPRGPVVGQVRLVTRLNDPRRLGGDDVDRVFVFIPDLHLMSPESAAGYKFAFLTLKPGVAVERDRMLDGVCAAARDWRDTTLVPAGHALTVVQLGDLIDLWRERQIAPGEAVTSMVGRVLDDNPVARAYLVSQRPDSLDADLLVGNHDLDAGDSVELRRASRSFAFRTGTRGDNLLVTHGDLFDPLGSSLPGRLKGWAARRFAPAIGAATFHLDRTMPHVAASATGARGSPPVVVGHEDAAFDDVVNVWVTDAGSTAIHLNQSHELLYLALEFARGLRAGDPASVEAMAQPAGLPDLRAMVVGHSHEARICVHDDAQDPGNSLVLVDGGAWLEYCQFAGEPPVASCQVGILCGGDARIYQLDPASSTRLGERAPSS